MRATLEFNLPDEQGELDAAVKIIEVKSCLDEICKTVWPGSAESVSRHFRVVKIKSDLHWVTLDQLWRIARAVGCRTG